MNKKQYFEDKYNLRRVEKCCGSCRYYDIDQERWLQCCNHPEVDNCANYNGNFVDADKVCDLWETDKR